jgi:hypothetical protein
MADIFEETFCLRCDKCNLNNLTMEPRLRQCPTYRATARAYIDLDFWPKDGAIAIDKLGRHVCLNFFSSDKAIMDKYEESVPQTYLGFTLRNLKDGYVAENPDGTPALRTGEKDRLETLLLVLYSDKHRSAEV